MLKAQHSPSSYSGSECFLFHFFVYNLDILWYFSSLLINSGHYQLTSTISTITLLVKNVMIKHGCPDWKKYTLCQICPALSHNCFENFGGIRCSMTCAQLGALGLKNSQHTRESWCLLMLKLAQKGKQNGQTIQRGQQN